MLNFSQFGLTMVVLLVEDKYRDFTESCAVVSEVLDDTLKGWICFACVLEVQTFGLLSQWPWKSFHGGVCALSPSPSASRDMRSRFVLWCGQEQVVGQAETLTALVPCEANQLRWKKNYTAGFLILKECNQPVKMNRNFWSQPVTFAFQYE